jgi:transcriptional antiterminator NusG
MQPHWYVVHTYSGHEAKVMNNILRRAETMRKSDKIVRIVVPMETETKTRAGKKTEVKRKLYPGYVFINMVMDDSTWDLVKSTIGVTGFIPPTDPGKKPVPLPDREIKEILEAVEGNTPVPVIKFEKGEVVRVTAGPFTEFTGKIEEVNADKEKLKVLISIFGRDTPVELDFQQVEKVI